MTGGSSAEVRRVDAFNKSLDGFVSTSPSVIAPHSERPKTADIMKPFAKKQGEERAEFGGARATQPQQPRPAAKPSPRKEKSSFFSRFRRKNSGRRGKRSRLKLKIAAAACSIVLLAGGGLALRAYLLSRNIFKGGGNSALLHNQDVDPSQLRGEGDGRINILILGKGGPEQQSGPDLTDTIIVASIDPLAKEAALLSIPRDLWVKSSAGGQSKINQVYHDAKQSQLNDYAYRDRDSDEAKQKSEQAGVDGLKQVVSDAIGVPIHYYGMIDFAGFRKAIDTVGGIDINVTEEMVAYETMRLSTGRYVLNVKEGREHFDGMRALAFARSRNTARSDFARADRQRAVILALKDKVLSTGTLANPLRINQLMSDFSGQLSTDFSANEMLRLYDLAKEISGDKVVSVGLDDYVTGDWINNLSVQKPKKGLFDYSEIQNYVRNIMRDSFLKKEDARIVILNGTSVPGLATKKSEELKSFGYHVVSVGDAPTDTYANTVLVDLRSGVNKYTLSYLQKRLRVQAVSAVPDATIDVSEADFVIILGASENEQQ